jgi:dipeptidyl aminopeptidase/acylaminoacyl peptidase
VLTFNEKNMKKLSIFLFSVMFLAANVAAQSAFSFNDLIKSRRVSSPQVSPDGKTIAFTIGDVNKEANKTLTHIYTMSVDGNSLKQITSGDKSNSSPRWSSDGKRIAFTTGGQIWTMNPDGSDRKQITSISTGAGNPVWSPDGKLIAFSSEVYPECSSDECNKVKDEMVDSSKVQAKVTTRLLYRHWNEWRDKKRTHVFTVSSSGGVAKQITSGDFDSPPYAASTGIDYAFSPDNNEIAYLRNPDKVEAISTNSDIFTVSLSGGTSKNITQNNKGYDVSPIYTSDGKYIIFRSQATAGFEADRWRIMRYNRQTFETIELTKGFDLQVEEVVVSADNKTLYFTAMERGLALIYSVPVETNANLKSTSAIKTLIREGFNADLNILPDGKSFVFSSSSIDKPAEIFRADNTPDGKTVQLTNTNADNGLAKAEEMEWKGAVNKTIHGFIVKPKNFDANKKYPLLVIIHGGPQSAFNNSWGYRWNSQVFANAGYVVFLPNPRGSVGYGQQFVNEISADWGGKVTVDIMNGVAELTKKSYIDKERIGATGASYGGYMVDWLLGHNNDPRFKFKAFASHAGVYNLENMSTVTEELWFANWEFKGMPWQNPVNYQKWSPHRFAKNFKTPTLVIHGELDYRVPVDQGLQLFTTLQVQNVESKLVIFPDEGHWIMKPQNSEFWYGQMLDWFGKYLKP